uniref:Protoporphyrinogen oxidase n=1 Tax=Strigomonas galati TaxID=1003336 RepID=G1C9P7_9TRYP|nr:protoporphyrinogen oxidase [Strigomonas galati]
MKYLLLYSTIHGHTKLIAEAIVEEIGTKDTNAECTVQDIKEFMTHNTLTSEGVAAMKHYDKVILGATVRYNQFAKEVHQFVRQYYPYLNSIPSAFYVVDVVACTQHRNTPETNPHTRRFLRASPWKPTKVAVFAGALHCSEYTFMERTFVRCIMKLAGEKTDPKTDKVYTDWDSVKAFAQKMAVAKEDDIPAAQEKFDKVAQVVAVQERRRRLYNIFAVSVMTGLAATAVGAIVAISNILTITYLLEYD